MQKFHPYFILTGETMVGFVIFYVLMTIDPFLAELLRQLEEFDANISALQKTKIQLTNQLEEAKRLCDEESKERQSLMGRFRTLEHEFDGKYAF